MEFVRNPVFYILLYLFSEPPQVRDGAALCEYLCWLEGRMVGGRGRRGGKKGTEGEDALTEISAADKLEQLRM